MRTCNSIFIFLLASIVGLLSIACNAKTEAPAKVNETQTSSSLFIRQAKSEILWTSYHLVFSKRLYISRSCFVIRVMK